MQSTLKWDVGVATEANDQAGLTYQAVNVEQAVPGKPSAKWQGPRRERTKLWLSQEYHSLLHGRVSERQK